MWGGKEMQGNLKDSEGGATFMRGRKIWWDSSGRIAARWRQWCWAYREAAVMLFKIDGWVHEMWKSIAMMPHHSNHWKDKETYLSGSDSFLLDNCWFYLTCSSPISTLFFSPASNSLQFFHCSCLYGLPAICCWYILLLVTCPIYFTG